MHHGSDLGACLSNFVWGGGEQSVIDCFHGCSVYFVVDPSLVELAFATAAAAAVEASAA